MSSIREGFKPARVLPGVADERVHGPQEPPRPPGPGERSCALCRKAYRPKRPHARYCGTACRAEAWRRRKARGEKSGREVNLVKPGTGTPDFVDLRDEAQKADTEEIHRAALQGRDTTVGLSGEVVSVEALREAELEAETVRKICFLAMRRSKAIARYAGLRLLGRIGDSKWTLRDGITISDVRAYLDEKGIELDWFENWPGSLFRHEWFQATGERRTTKHRSANCRKVNVYELTTSGRIAVDDLARTLYRGEAHEVEAEQ